MGLLGRLDLYLNDQRLVDQVEYLLAKVDRQPKFGILRVENRRARLISACKTLLGFGWGSLASTLLDL